MSSEQASLLPKTIQTAHRLGPHPIRFPSGGNRKAGYEDPTALPDEEAAGPPPEWATSLPPTYKSGLPKITRECLVSECVCYGKYIVAVFVVFGVGGTLIALWASGRI
ncbi:hypothetical protein B0J17DRAFT_358614 [Rhizoctonia solani]|nr:hypothetical protein B0J17DRAFT_358614 [Rhizoctonia solani]